MSAEGRAARLIRSLNGLTLRDGVFAVPRDHGATVDSWAMSLMRSARLTRIYESAWRPAVVRALSTLTYTAEDAIVDRHLEQRSRLRLLDLCCGTARTSRRWIPRHADVLGIDLSLAMLREARRRAPSERLVLVQADAGSPIAQAGTFDAAFCFAALHLLERPEDVLSAAAAALRPRGLFFAWVATSSGPMRVAPVQTLARTLGLLLWEPKQLLVRLVEHGFEIREIQNFGAVEFAVAQRVR